jgi:hypothetical protein
MAEFIGWEAWLKLSHSDRWLALQAWDRLSYDHAEAWILSAMGYIKQSMYKELEAKANEVKIRLKEDGYDILVPENWGKAKLENAREQAFKDALKAIDAEEENFCHLLPKPHMAETDYHKGIILGLSMARHQIQKLSL